MTQARYFIAIVIAALAAQLGLAQDTSKKQPHYKLVELDAFGGPNSFVRIVTYEIKRTVGTHAISNRGTVAGYGVLTNGDKHDFVVNPLRGWRDVQGYSRRNDVASRRVAHYLSADPSG